MSSPIPDLATLNAVLVVLRGVLQALAAAGQIDPAKVSYLLQAWAHDQGMAEPAAFAMLMELAEGMDIIAEALGSRAEH